MHKNNCSEIIHIPKWILIMIRENIKQEFIRTYPERENTKIPDYELIISMARHYLKEEFFIARDRIQNELKHNRY